MKQIVLLGITVIAAAMLLINSTGCKVNLTNPPYVEIDTIVGYVYDDTTLQQGTVFSVFVYAAVAGNDDILETGKITRSINGGPDTVLQTMNFATDQFYNYYSYIVGRAATPPAVNRETYTFTFGNEHGVTTSASITVKDTCCAM